MVEIPPSHVFACEMAEIVSQHGESDLAMTTFTAVFEKQFGRTPKPQNYGCATFDQVLNSSKAYMEVSTLVLLLRDHPCERPPLL